MNTIRIFLASSAELEKDRREFEIFIGRQNKKLQQRISFYILTYGRILVMPSPTRLQDEYNKKIEAADIFIMLFFTKVGMYT